MPRLPDTSVPAYRLHRASGQAVVTLNGRDHYLGVHKSATSRTEYNRLISEWLAGGRRLPVDPNAVTVAEIIAAYRKHAQRYYRDASGTLSRAVTNIDEAIRPVLKLYGRTPAVEFGPLRLKSCREALVAAGRVRTNVNRHVTRIRSVFKWAVENEIIPPAVYHGLQAVAGLRRGRSEVQESEPVKPVAIEHVEAVLPFLSRQVAAMVRLQMLTGMRPGEVVLMRGADIDTTGKLWIYRPQRHKTQIHGQAREVYLGPKAQSLVRPFLNPDLSAYLFSPADAERERREAIHASRKTPMNCGNRPGTNRRRRPKHQPGERYDVAAYYNAIRRGCDQAFPPPAELAKHDDETAKAWAERLTAAQRVELKTWRDAHRWHPHQLRHTAATRLRKEYGLEAAQVILGHKTLTVTQVYAEKNVAAAMKIMGEVG